MKLSRVNHPKAILGTEGSDNILDRTRSDDFIFGFAGKDLLEDSIEMGVTQPSDDMFFGGKGNDHINSLFGNDQLYGGQGNDEFCVWKDNDRRVLVDGGIGRDTLTLWGFDEDRASIKFHENRTVVEQGSNKVVILDNVEHWEFY